MKGVPRLFGWGGPGFGAFRIVPAGGIEPIDTGQPRRAMKNGVSQTDSIQSLGFLRRKVLLVEKYSWPARAKGRGVVDIILSRNEKSIVVIRVNVNSNSDLLQII